MLYMRVEMSNLALVIIFANRQIIVKNMAPFNKKLHKNILRPEMKIQFT